MKPHGNTGNQHARKERKKDVNIIFRASSEDKARWTAEAESEGLSLSKWITRRLG